MKNNFLILFFIILLFRIALFVLPSFQIDMSDWQAWSYRLIAVGFRNFYSQNYFSDYFPGYLYVLWLIGNTYQFLFSNLSFGNFRFEVLIKSVTLLFDIGTAYFVYKIVKIHSPKLSKIGAFLYLSNPAVIFNSSIWGQIDGIFTFFLIYSAYLLVEKRRSSKSALSSSIAILVKPQSLALLPVFLAYNLNSKKNLAKVILVIFLVPIALSVPFFLNDPFFGLFKLAQKSVDVYPFSSLYAFNFWGIFNWWQPDNKIILLSYKTWGSLFYLISILSILIPIIKNKKNSVKFYFASALSFLSFYLLLTRMHERYLFPFFAFILLAALIKKSKLLISTYFFLSLVHLINLWYVYYYYNFVYNNTLNIVNPFFNFISANHGLFSIFSVIVYLFIMIYYFYSNEKNLK